MILLSEDIKRLTNTELVKLCAQEPGNRKVWVEFYSRFDERIWLAIYRECREKGFTENRSQFHQTVQDLVQDVYLRLVDKNCKALRDFIGVSENSIFTYLGIIAKNVVRNYLTKKGAQKRLSIEKSIDEVILISEESGEVFIKDVLKSTYIGAEEEFKPEICKEQIEDILDEFLKGKASARNKLIFKLHFYEGFSPEEITKQFGVKISSKRVRNLISEIKKKLRKELLAKNMEIY